MAILAHALPLPQADSQPARTLASCRVPSEGRIRTPHPPSVLRRGSDVGRLLGDRYILLDWIGRGGMADVFLGRDCHSGRFVAIKMLAREHRNSAPHRERMAHELALTRRVAHRFVIRVLDSGASEDGLPFLVLDALVGETLHDYLRREQVMPVGQAFGLVQQLAEGIAAVHAAGVVHGDIKPNNVFLNGPVGVPKSVTLIDFGLARLVGEARDEQDDTVTGTIEYMAPEQVLADPVDGRTDIYGFGALCFRWLTGELPFDTESDTALLAHQVFTVPPPPSWLSFDIDAQLEAVILLSMKKNPHNRYQSMAEVSADLLRIAEGQRVEAAPRLVSSGDVYPPQSERARQVMELFGGSAWDFELDARTC
jgi:eukaryotic-like serine/threonine-protein kinase